MTAVVLDTSVASFLFLNRPERLPYLAHLNNSQAVISFQTVAKMRFGALRANWGTTRRTLLERFLSNYYIVDSSDRLSDAWAAIMLDAERAGRRLEAGDGWIAATAALLNAPLLTYDQDFSPACPSLTVITY